MGRGGGVTERIWGRGALAAVAGVFFLLAGCSSGSNSGTPGGSKLSSGVTGEPGYLVYWDQNEEVDFLSVPAAGHSQVLGQLMPT